MGKRLKEDKGVGGCWYQDQDGGPTKGLEAEVIVGEKNVQR